ncbi:phosphatidylserine/phosphatidylglycerophosphate/cardiolipin synthase [Rivularia sp. PCC 7116]|nr:phosphatidylserine/phosphatidylglycerophosphate/cardiolipin synthase [Rivularia sp. PCC 7116]
MLRLFQCEITFSYFYSVEPIIFINFGKNKLVRLVSPGRLPCNFFFKALKVLVKIKKPGFLKKPGFSTSRLLTKYIKLLYFFLLILPLTSCQQSKSNNQIKALPQDSSIQVYFNHSQTSEYRESYREKIRKGDDLEQIIIDAISQANSTIDIAVQELRLPLVAQALVKKQQAGIKVRIILENNYSRTWSDFTPQELTKLTKRERDKYQEFLKFADTDEDGKLSQEEINQRDALKIIKNAKIPLIDDTADGSKGSGLMHHKFIVIDNRFVIVTSANFTLSGIHGDYDNYDSLGNVNNLIKIDSVELADIFTNEFNIMWGDGVGGKFDSKFGLQKPRRDFQQVNFGNNKVTVSFSPTSPTKPWIHSSNGLIGKTLKSAVNSIDSALFVFSAQRLSNILETSHQKNVKIRTVIEPDFAYRFYSEGLDMMGLALSNKCKYELNNQPWENPINTIGIPLLTSGDLLHHKYAVIDKKIVITGSHNWTEAANIGNDETVLVIENPKVAAHYVREFERLYVNAEFDIPRRIEKKVKQQEKECGEIKAPSTFAEKVIVDINTATVEELVRLPGVGKKLAERIIKARGEKRFDSLEDLERVKGIGKKMLVKLEGRVSF